SNRSIKVGLMTTLVRMLAPIRNCICLRLLGSLLQALDCEFDSPTISIAPSTSSFILPRIQRPSKTSLRNASGRSANFPGSATLYRTWNKFFNRMNKSHTEYGPKKLLEPTPDETPTSSLFMTHNEEHELGLIGNRLDFREQIKKALSGYL